MLLWENTFEYDCFVWSVFQMELEEENKERKKRKGIKLMTDSIWGSVYNWVFNTEARQLRKEGEMEEGNLRVRWQWVLYI
jgi:hypothetical protein